MHVVTTPPSFKKILLRKREKIYCQFCFCAHVDVIKIEKHWAGLFESWLTLTQD